MTKRGESAISATTETTMSKILLTARSIHDSGRLQSRNVFRLPKSTSCDLVRNRTSSSGAIWMLQGSFDSGWAILDAKIKSSRLASTIMSSASSARHSSVISRIYVFCANVSLSIWAFSDSQSEGNENEAMTRVPAALSSEMTFELWFLSPINIAREVSMLPEAIAVRNHKSKNARAAHIAILTVMIWKINAPRE